MTSSKKGEASIINGLSGIINTENTNPSVDLKDLEQQFISDGLIQNKSKDIPDQFADELNSLASKYGINFDEPKETPNNTLSNTPNNNLSQFLQDDDNDDHNNECSDTHNNDNDYYNNDDGDYHNDDNHYNDTVEQKQSSKSFHFGRSKSINELTKEQERREYINSVMGSESSNSLSFEKERKEDLKCAMLADIDSLMSTLSNEDVDLSRIPKVDGSSSYKEVEDVLKILRHKNDHARCCSFAEELLLFGAYALESLFDGKKTWFGKYQPDLTGWHNTVNVKLRRMRHDTGQLVNNVMQDYQIGPGMRVLLELIPSLILYSRANSQQHSQVDLFSEQEMNEFSKNIRDNSD